MKKWMVLNIEKNILKIMYPIRYEEYVYKYSEDLRIDPMLTFAISRGYNTSFCFSKSHIYCQDKKTLSYLKYN